MGSSKEVEVEVRSASDEELIVEESSRAKPSYEPAVVSRYKIVQAFREIVVWYPANYDEEEKKLLRKLDWAILTYACLGFFVKSIDASNVSYAYVSGMKEDLDLYGNQYNWLSWMYQIGYCAGQVPCLILLSRPKLSKYVFPTLEIIYGVLTFCQSKVSHVHQLYALRFLIGFFESPAYAGTHYILGKWYGSKPYRGNAAELFKRCASWYSTQSIAGFFSGHLQAAAYKNLSGKGGYSGWQWLFLIDGIITIPIALYGFVIWPGIPEAGKPWYLTEEQYKLVGKRSERYGVENAQKITLKTFKDTFSDWKWYLFCFCYTVMCISWYPVGNFSLWLKAQKRYSVYQINTYPTVGNVIALIVTVLGTIFASVYPPWIIFTIGATGFLVCSIIMSVYHVPAAAVFFAFYYANINICTTTILYSYVNIVMRENNEVKAIIYGSMMLFGQSIPTSLSFALFKTTDKANPKEQAPQWHTGWRVSIGLSVAIILTFWLITFLHEREKKRGTAFSKNYDEDEEDVSSSANSIVTSDLELGGKVTARHTVKEVAAED